MLVCTSVPSGVIFYFVDNCPDSVSERDSESKNRRFSLLPEKERKGKERRESKNLLFFRESQRDWRFFMREPTNQPVKDWRLL
jgi:hypothetical protein